MKYFVKFVLGLSVFLLIFTFVSACTPPEPFPPPEGYSSWEEYEQKYDEMLSAALTPDNREVSESINKLVEDEKPVLTPTTPSTNSSSKEGSLFSALLERAKSHNNSSVPDELRDIGYFDKNGIFYHLKGGDGEPIVLTNNPAAVNVTFAEVIDFIKKDPTDTNEYRNGIYVCGDYAEDVHNHAEAAGIRAGWVGVDFYDSNIGHAINAFETTDKGLVYVDCTELDFVAYVVVTEHYGCIEIDKASSLEYSFYKSYKWKKEAVEKSIVEFNEKVIEFNEECIKCESMLSGYNQLVDDFNNEYSIYIEEYEYYQKITDLRTQLNSKLSQRARQVVELIWDMIYDSRKDYITQAYLTARKVELDNFRQEVLKNKADVEAKFAALEKFEEDLKLMEYQIGVLEKNLGTGQRHVPVLGIVKDIHVFWGKE